MKNLLLAVTLFGWVSLCHAEPSQTVRYLMNEPVTLFDWGIVRLYEYVDGFTNHYLQTNSVQDIYSTVTYDSSKDQILISFVVTRKPNSKGESPAYVQSTSREICRTIIQEMRREFFVERDKQVRRSSGIYRFFAHVGARGEKEPLDSYEQVENMTVLRVSVYSDKDPGRLILHSETPLMGKQTTYSETR